MSAELHMSSAADAVEFPYRALSRSAIASLIFTLLALPGLVPTFEPMLLLSLLGIASALVALRSIRRYPDEYSGAPLATFGLVACLAILVGGSAMHTYIYLTEVPEGYQRVQFYKLQQEQDAPDGPTELAAEIDGKTVFIKGYIHPSSGGGMLRQFILVPDLGTCCFGGQPRSSDMIEVTLLGGQTVKAGLTRRKLAGKFILNDAPRALTDFDNAVFYRLRADIAK
jgi:hypothetical protein